MADFAKWGYAIAEALGRDGKEFIEAYEENRKYRNEEIIANNTLAQAVIKLMEKKYICKGTMQKAYEQLKMQFDHSLWG